MSDTIEPKPGTTNTKILSPENTPMFIAVAFIIAITGLVISLISYSRVKDATMGLSILQMAKAKEAKDIRVRQDARSEALEKRVARLEALAAEAQKAADAPPAEATDTDTQ